MRLTAAFTALLLLACTPAISRPPAKPTITPSGAATADASLVAFIPVAEHFIEQHRGLKFKTSVKVTFLPDLEFNQELAKTNGTDTTGYVTEAKVLHALGLLDGLPDLAKAEQSLEDSSVIGFYDPKTKQLFVRGVDAKPSVRHVLVHELTHALQDQWFSIDRSLSNQDESELAFRTLVEGDAVRIENEYIALLSQADKRQIQAANVAGGRLPPGTPEILVELDSFPYQAGPPFTEAVVAKGQDRLDAAFTTPPTSTAQVIHPDLFLAGRAAASVDLPTADGAVIDKGVLGEFGLDLILERLLARGEVTRSDVSAVATNWSGDRYIAWDQGSQACVRARIVMNGEPARAALLGVLRQFALDHPGTTVVGGSPVLFTACA